MYGGRLNRRADPRPITSREFISEQVNDMIMYLANNQYNQRISPKLFNPPTGKEFKNVVTFLFRILDEGYELAGRIEDEVPLVFKGLRYPFSISKTGLTAVGSPHTWPALLAALSWLVELLEYDSAVRAAEDDDGEAEAEGGDERLFFTYLRQSYSAFLAGDDRRFEALDEEIAGTFQAKQDEIRAETSAVEDETARIRAELEALRADESVLPQLRGKRDDLVSDKGKFEHLIGQLQDHQRALDAKLAQREEEAEGKEAELAEAQADLDDVRRTVETQELSPEDVDRLRSQAARHRDKAAAVSRQRKEATMELEKAESVMAKAVEALEARLVEYHRAAASLHLLAPDDENADGLSFELELDTARLRSDGPLGASRAAPEGRRDSLAAQLSKLTTADILGTDVRGVLRPALRELKTTMHRRAMEERAAEAESRDTTEATKEAVQDLRMRLSESEKRVHGLEDTYRREKQAVDRALEKLVSQTDEVEAKVEQARAELQEAEDEADRLDERAIRRVREAASKRVDDARAEASRALAGLRADMAAVAAYVDRVRAVLGRGAEDAERFVDSAVEEAKDRLEDLERRCADPAAAT